MPDATEEQLRALEDAARITATEDAMTDKPEPVLSAEEWDAVLGEAYTVSGSIHLDYDVTHYEGLERIREVRHRVADPAAVIAIHNNRLPDSDRRKITREWVTMLRAAAVAARNDDHYFARELGEEEWTPGREVRIAARCEAIADALASYLPPE